MLPLAAPLLLDQALSPPVFLDGIAPSLLFCFLGNEVFLHSDIDPLLGGGGREIWYTHQRRAPWAKRNQRIRKNSNSKQ
jgi:hypothetical protein